MAIKYEYRMNFLAREKVEFTYRRIGKLLLIWAIFLSFIGVVQVLRYVYAEYHLTQKREYVEQLTREKDRRMALAQMAGVQKNRQLMQEDLYMIFRRPPEWSSVLGQLSRCVPRQLQLTSVMTKPGEGEYMIMEIKGVGTSVRAITEFIMKLEETKAFKGVGLVGTHWNKSGGDFRFELYANVLSSTG